MLAALDAAVVVASVACLLPVAVAIVAVGHDIWLRRRRRRLNAQLLATGAVTVNELRELEATAGVS